MARTTRPIFGGRDGGHFGGYDDPASAGPTATDGGCTMTTTETPVGALPGVREAPDGTGFAQPVRGTIRSGEGR